MKIDFRTSKRLKDNESLRKRNAFLSVCWLLALLIIMAFALLLGRLSLDSEMYLVLLVTITLSAFYCVIKVISHILAYRFCRKTIHQYQFGLQRLQQDMLAGTAKQLAESIGSLRAQNNPLLDSLLNENEQSLWQLSDLRFRQELQKQFDAELELFKQQHREKAIEIRNQHPLYQALFSLQTAITHLQNRKLVLQAEWKEAYTKFSWWNKLKYVHGPDFRVMNSKIGELENTRTELLSRHKVSAKESA